MDVGRFALCRQKTFLQLFCSKSVSVKPARIVQDWLCGARNSFHGVRPQNHQLDLGPNQWGYCLAPPLTKVLPHMHGEMKCFFRINKNSHTAPTWAPIHSSICCRFLRVSWFSNPCIKVALSDKAALRTSAEYSSIRSHSGYNAHYILGEAAWKRTHWTRDDSFVNTLHLELGFHTGHIVSTYLHWCSICRCHHPWNGIYVLWEFISLQSF